MAEILKRLGGSKSTIYSYYPSKAELVQMLTPAMLSATRIAQQDKIPFREAATNRAKKTKPCAEGLFVGLMRL